MSTYKISSDLEHLAYPIEDLQLLPGNYNDGDVRGVAASYDRFGQQKTIVARKIGDSEKGVVLAGNTQLRAARLLGWTHIAVNWIRDEDGWDDSEAAAFAVTDNETNRRGKEDLEAKRSMISQFEDDFDLLEVAGFDLASLQELDESIDHSLIESPLPGGMDITDETPMDSNAVEDRDVTTSAPEQPAAQLAQRAVIQTTIIFDNEEQQQRWYSFVRWLKAEMPEMDTLASRIHSFLGEYFESDN